MSNLQLIPLLQATWQTIYMVFVASFLSIVAGTALGVILFLTRPQQALSNAWINQSLGLLVNITRSVPYIILMISILPLTRLIIGTTIGTNAAIVPLTLAAIPFYARICESALADVSPGIREAMHSMGATTWQVVYKALLPESFPTLIRGATLTIIALIGYSAMAGAVGGGGLGELAINYGYQRFDVLVMLETVIVLVILVQLIQWFGDYLARRPRLKPIIMVSIVLWLASIVSQAWPTNMDQHNTLRVGVMSGWSVKVLEVAKEVAWKRYHLNLQIVSFDDYIQPNTALANGSIDANIFQHVPYLDAQIKAHGYSLVPVGKTFVYPMGFYSQKITNINQLPDNALIAIPNDPSNEARALLLLQKAGLIQLKPEASTLATLRDIANNPKNLRFITLNAAQLPRVLKDATLVAITNDFVKPAGLSFKEAIIHEGADSPYANVIVVRKQDVNNSLVKELVQAMHSKPVLDATLELFPDGAAIPAWKSSD